MPHKRETFYSADAFPEIPLRGQVHMWVGFYLLVNGGIVNPYDLRGARSLQEAVNGQIGRNIYIGVIQDELVDYRAKQVRGEFN